MTSPVYNQIHYRIRSDDSVGLNTDSGWAAAEDTNTTIGTGVPFRIRFRVTETLNKGSANTFKLQVNRNSLGWADIDVNLGLTAPAVLAVVSSQYTDGDATSSQLLTSGGGSYVNGEGDEDNNVSSSIDNQETEMEFCLMIMSFHDGPTQNVAGDTLEFRVVEGDGTVFTGTQNNPTITVSETTGYIGGTYIEHPCRIGPFCDTNGNLYFFIEYANTENSMAALKSTDGGDTWRAMDAANSPTQVDIETLDVFQDGDTLHITHCKSNAYYHRFRMSDHPTNPDTWEITDEVIDNTITSHTTQSISLAVRSDSTIVAFYIDAASPDRCRYKIRSIGGSWGSQQTVDTEASVNFVTPWCILGASDLTHVFYKDDTSGIIYHRTLNSSDVLSGRQSVITGIEVSDTHDDIPFAEPVYWDSSGNEKIMLCYQKAQDGQMYTKVITNGGSPGTEATATDNSVTTDEGSNHMSVASLVVDSATDTVYLFYSDTITNDIYRDSNADEGGWGTDAEEQDAVTCHWVRGQVFTHSAGNGGAKVLGYAWDDGSAGGVGFIWYNEFVISTGGNAASVSDSISLSEAVAAEVLVSTSVSDSVSVSESVELELVNPVNVSDAISLAETVKATLVTLASASDNISVAESVEVALADLATLVSDSISLAESVQVSLIHLVNISDSISLAESVQVALSGPVTVSDTISLAETVQTMLLSPVNVSDPVSVSENVSLSVQTPGQPSANVSDSISLAEAIQVDLVSPVSPSDTISLAEAVKTELGSLIATSDSVAIAEAIQAALITRVAPSDSISLAEAVQVALADLAIAAADAVSLAEAIQAALTSFIPTSDTITAAESVETTLVSLVSPTEGVGVSESTQVELVSKVNISDAVTIAESTSVSLVTPGVPSPFASDNIAVAESVSVEIGLEVNVSESISLAEAVKLTLVHLVSASETISLAEALAAALLVQIEISDAFSVADSPTVATTALAISVSDTVAIAEGVSVSPEVAGALSIAVSDAISLAESLSLTISVTIVTSDTVTLTETITVTLVHRLSVSDNVSLADVAALTQVYPLGVSDSLVLTDTPALAPPGLGLVASDSVTLTETALVIRLITALIDIALSDAAVTGATLGDAAVTGLALGDASANGLALGDAAVTSLALGDEDVSEVSLSDASRT